MEPYVGLFVAAFAAATLLPLSSEALLAGLAASGGDPASLWFWATAGNTLGATMNWTLGRYLLRFRGRRWFPFDPDRLGNAQRWFQRWGVWSLLLTWLPVVGDGLTFVAGLLRVRFAVFFVLTAIGKGARYAVLLGLLDWWID